MSAFISPFKWNLNQRLCDAFGIKPVERWIVSNDGGKSMRAWTDRNGPWYSAHELEQWLKERHSKHQYRDHKILAAPVYPRVTTEDAEALKLLRAMEASRWRILCSIARRSGGRPPFDQIRWDCELRACALEVIRAHPMHDRLTYGCGSHPTFAMAVCRAAIDLCRKLKIDDFEISSLREKKGT